MLAALWLLLAAHVVSGFFGYTGAQFGAALTLSFLTGFMLLRWWPRQTAPGLLKVLIWGFAWAPAGFALTGEAGSSRRQGADI